MSNMIVPRRSHEAGELNILLIPLILVVVLLLAVAGFAGWAYMERQEYKLRSDQKVASAVAEAKRVEGLQKDRAFAEAEKNPLKIYRGPEQFGGVKIDYPKTWSTYVHSSVSSNQPLNAYLHPNVVPSVSDSESIYALRIEVLPRNYTQVLKTLEGRVRLKEVKVSPFVFPSVPDTVGVRVDGKIIPSKKTEGSMIIMPIRDKTLQVWTEAPEFVSDFDKIIIPNLTFKP